MKNIQGDQSQQHSSGERVSSLVSQERSLKPKWTGVDDDLQEKDTGSGAIYDAESGEFLFRVPPEYRVEIVQAVNAHDALVAAAKAALKYVDNLNEDAPLDSKCKECVGRVFFDKGTPEPPMCWIHQLEAALALATVNEPARLSGDSVRT